MNENKRKKEIKNENNEKRYICKLCDVGCRYKCDYTRHLLTRGHIAKTNENNEKPRPFSCENCGKKYKHSQGLSKHKKKCKTECNIDVTDVTKNVTNVTENEMSKMKCPEAEMSKNLSTENIVIKLEEIFEKIIEEKDDQILTLMKLLAKKSSC